MTENGHLIIYAAEHKNVSLKTSTGGYINLNGENLVLLAQDVSVFYFLYPNCMYYYLIIYFRLKRRQIKLKV